MARKLFTSKRKLSVYFYKFLNYFFKIWPNSLLIVSHDRNFLNSVAQEILYLHSQKIDPYRGNYENFLKTKTENLKNQQREYEAQLEYRQHIQIFIDRFRYNANRAAQVQSKIKLLEKMHTFHTYIHT